MTKTLFLFINFKFYDSFLENSNEYLGLIFYRRAILQVVEQNSLAIDLSNTTNFGFFFKHEIMNIFSKLKMTEFSIYFNEIVSNILKMEFFISEFMKATKLIEIT